MLPDISMNTEHSEQTENKYILLDLIGTGGMAEVYKCRLSGKKGFEKLVVLKKLLPQYAEDPEIVSNFIDEAKLAALLQHENIAQIYDFGEIDGSYFIAMEYLFGKDLHSVMKRAKEVDGSMAVELALFIAARICEGMEHAHSQKDLQHRPLNIIHRDLSPHNVFVTYEGKVKIIDFGIAKAELFDNRTQAGMVKGKVSYMSPEQLIAKEVDLRSDIFAIGILLYEMLSGSRMYSGDTATLIRKCMQVEYEKAERAVPGLQPEIYKILEKALQPDRNLRYQSCAEMLAAIEECLFSLNQRSTASFLGKYICQLFAREYEEEKNRVLVRSETTVPEEDGSNDDRTAFLAHRQANDKAHDDRTVILSVSEGGIGESGFHGSKVPGVGQPEGKRLTKSGRFRLWAIGAAGTVVVAVVLYLSLNSVPEKNKVPVVTAEPARQSLPAVAVSKPKEQEYPAVQPVDSENEIEDLLRKAETAWNEKRYTMPEYDSAFRYYHKVLSIEPGNSIARQGIAKIGAYYADLVEQALGENNFLEAGQYITKGLTVVPQNERLLALRDGMAVKKEKLILNLTGKAEQALRRNDLTTPTDDCAYKYYNEILKIERQNPIALNGMKKIADRYAVLAEDAYRNLNLTNAREFVRSGLAVAPNHPKLLELQRDLSRSKPGIFFKSLEKSFGTVFK